VAVDVLAIGAHPDDAEIGCAGFLLKAKARGLKTGIAVLTKGEMSAFADADTRVAEAEAAAEILTVDEFRIFDLPDAGVEINTENTVLVTHLLKELRPRVVLTPHFDDHHPDHVAAARLVERAFFLATRVSIAPEYEPLAPRPKHLTFPLSFYRTCRPTLVIDITDVYSVKQRALQAHGSQYAPALFAVEMVARYYGMMMTVAYGEGFLHQEPLALTRDLAIV
jgi:bacillithiol biosynthesis deacetylase BshB1